MSHVQVAFISKSIIQRLKIERYHTTIDSLDAKAYDGEKNNARKCYTQRIKCTNEFIKLKNANLKHVKKRKQTSK